MSLSDSLGSMNNEVIGNDLGMNPRSSPYMKHGYVKNELDYPLMVNDMDSADLDRVSMGNDGFHMMDHTFGEIKHENDMLYHGDHLHSRNLANIGVNSTNPHDTLLRPEQSLRNSSMMQEGLGGMDQMISHEHMISHDDMGHAGSFNGVPPGTMPTANMSRNVYDGSHASDGSVHNGGDGDSSVADSMSMNPNRFVTPVNRLSPVSQSGNVIGPMGSHHTPEHAHTIGVHNNLANHQVQTDAHMNGNGRVEYKPPFVVDLAMVRKTMEGVNRALGVDLGGTEVGETALLSKPNGDSKGEDDEPRDGANAKAEVSHVRLISDACGYIVASVGRSVLDAAHESYLENSAQNMPHLPPKPPIRKKRGGILGFKELAMRANLSPWHFHRVFRFVTGVTPKAYGEALWEYLMIEAGFDLDNEELTINRAVASFGSAGGSAAANNLTTSSSSSSSPQSPVLSSSQSHGSKQSNTSKHSSFSNTSKTSTSSTSLSSSALGKPKDSESGFGEASSASDNGNSVTTDGSSSSVAVADESSESSNRIKSPTHTGQGPQSSLPPLSGPVAPGRVRKSSSRSRGTRSRSRNRSQSQNQVLNALSAETGGVSEGQQPVRRGRSFSRVAQRPTLVNTDQSLQGYPGSGTTNNSNMTPLTTNDMPKFSPHSISPNLMNQSANVQDDFIGDTFHPSTEFMGMPSVYPFDVPDMNNLTLYQSERVSGGLQPNRHSPGSDAMHNNAGMNGSTGTSMHGEGIYETQINSVPLPSNFVHNAQRYSSLNDDEYDFNGIPAVPGGADSYLNGQDAYFNVSAVPRRVTPSQHDNMRLQENSGMRGHQHHSHSEQYNGSGGMMSGLGNSENSKSTPSMASFHHQSQKSSTRNSLNNSKSALSVSGRLSSPPVSGNYGYPDMAQYQNPQSGSSGNSSQTVGDDKQIENFFQENLQWEVYNQPNDLSSKTDQLGDLPTSFYLGFHDSPTYGDDSKNEPNDMTSALIGEEDPPLLSRWNDGGETNTEHFSY